MSAISTWSTTSGSNNATPPDGFPEGMAQNLYNNSAREVMAAVRSWYEDPEWIDITSAFTLSKVAANQIKIASYLGTVNFPVGCRIQMIPGPVICNVTVSTYSAPDTTLTVDGTVPAVPTQLLRFISNTARTGAFTATGNTIGQIALHTATGPLKSAAYKDSSTAIGDVPVNTVAAALGTAAYVNTGTTSGTTVPLNTSSAALGASAYLAPPARVYARKTADVTMGGAIAVISSLSNISVPGTPDGAKKYRVNAQVQVLELSSVTGETLTLKMGAAGTTADTTLLSVQSEIGGSVWCSFCIVGFEITPASGDKVSLCWTSSSSNTRISGASPAFSWIEIVEIQ